MSQAETWTDEDAAAAKLALIFEGDDSTLLNSGGGKIAEALLAKAGGRMLHWNHHIPDYTTLLAEWVREHLTDPTVREVVRTYRALIDAIYSDRLAAFA